MLIDDALNDSVRNDLIWQITKSIFWQSWDDKVDKASWEELTEKVKKYSFLRIKFDTKNIHFFFSSLLQTPTSSNIHENKKIIMIILPLESDWNRWRTQSKMTKKSFCLLLKLRTKVELNVVIWTCFEE